MNEPCRRGCKPLAGKALTTGAVTRCLLHVSASQEVHKAVNDEEATECVLMPSCPCSTNVSSVESQCGFAQVLTAQLVAFASFGSPAAGCLGPRPPFALSAAIVAGHIVYYGVQLITSTYKNMATLTSCFAPRFLERASAPRGEQPAKERFNHDSILEGLGNPCTK